MYCATKSSLKPRDRRRRSSSGRGGTQKTCSAGAVAEAENEAREQLDQARREAARQKEMIMATVSVEVGPA